LLFIWRFWHSFFLTLELWHIVTATIIVLVLLARWIMVAFDTLQVVFIRVQIMIYFDLKIFTQYICIFHISISIIRSTLRDRTTLWGHGNGPLACAIDIFLWLATNKAKISQMFVLSTFLEVFPAFRRCSHSQMLLYSPNTLPFTK
jgi:hypothetical protein